MTRMKLKIENAQVVLPDEICNTTVMVEDGRIADIDVAHHSAADETVSARGLHLIPGVIDDQVHFREPGFEHKEDLKSASRACATGAEMACTARPGCWPLNP